MYYCISIEQFKKDISVEMEYIDLSIERQISSRIYLSKQKTGYGIKNFMICPVCGTRHVELFTYEQNFMCRKCYPKNIYSGIQNHAKGGNENIAYRMRRYATTHGITIQRFPFDFTEYEKPRNIKAEYWLKIITILQALENMRYQTFAFHKKWGSKVIRSILTWENSCLYLFDLIDIQNRCNQIFWDKGIDMHALFKVND